MKHWIVWLLVVYIFGGSILFTGGCKATLVWGSEGECGVDEDNKPNLLTIYHAWDSDTPLPYEWEYADAGAMTLVNSENTMGEYIRIDVCKPRDAKENVTLEIKGGDKKIDVYKWAQGGKYLSPEDLKREDFATLTTLWVKAKEPSHYSDSDPKLMEIRGSGNEDDPPACTSAPGHLRLWTTDGTADWNAAEVPDGPFIKSGISYKATDLGDDGMITLYVEGIRQSSSIADQEIRVDIDPMGNGDWIENMDIIRLTVARIEMELYAQDNPMNRIPNDYPFPNHENMFTEDFRNVEGVTTVPKRFGSSGIDTIITDRRHVILIANPLGTEHKIIAKWHFSPDVLLETVNANGTRFIEELGLVSLDAQGKAEFFLSDPPGSAFPLPPDANFGYWDFFLDTPLYIIEPTAIGRVVLISKKRWEESKSLKEQLIVFK